MAKSNVIQKPSKIVFDRSLGAIKLDKEIKEKTLLLEDDKTWLRENAELGTTLPIPGYGSVQFKNGAAAKPGGEEVTSVAWSLEAFTKLSPFIQKKLIDGGVIKITKSKAPPTPAGTAAITFIHNK